MHPARLSLLAIKHKQWRAITSRQRDESGATHIALECGHGTEIAPHFDMTHAKEFGCVVCGEQYVRTARQYAKEFHPMCAHESIATADGHGACCRFCGETTA